MKNFEKYITNFGAMVENHIEECKRKGFCNRCIFKEVCKRKLNAVEWLLAEYKEPIQLSHDEYVILKNVSERFKWIVRHDSGGYLWLFVNRPTKEGYCTWIDLEEYDDEHFDVFNHLFQFIKKEDEEPYEIAKLIADYEKEHGDE